MVRWVVGSILHGVDPLSYFSFQPVLHDWCNKVHGMWYSVCGMMHIKEPLLLIGKSSLCGSSRFPLKLSEWSIAPWANALTTELHEGSMRRPIAPWVNALTTELHLAPEFSPMCPSDVNVSLTVMYLNKQLWLYTWNSLIKDESSALLFVGIVFCEPCWCMVSLRSILVSEPL